MRGSGAGTDLCSVAAVCTCDWLVRGHVRGHVRGNGAGTDLCSIAALSARAIGW